MRSQKQELNEIFVNNVYEATEAFMDHLSSIVQTIWARSEMQHS